MLFEEEVQKIGYLSRSIPEGIDLKAAINQLKIEKKSGYIGTLLCSG